MQHLPPETEAGWLATHRPDVPVWFFHPGRLQATARRFQEGFPGLVTYAVKANPDRQVLEHLIAQGITAFDVASPAEMQEVRALCPDAVLHYHNPVRSAEETAAARTAGVQSYSVDDGAGLAQVAQVSPGAEIAVRIALPVTGAAYDFGGKFGAGPDEASDLLRAADRAGLRCSMTFHVGTQCARPEAWQRYVTACATAARAAGVTLLRLNVGGGFPARRSPAEAAPCGAIFAAIRASVAEAFADPPALVCEPGRAMVADAFSLALRVKAARRGGAIVLNDGIYGALAEMRDIGPVARLAVIGPDGQPRIGAPVPRVVFGPTCDSLDRLPDPLPLPGDVTVGDWVLVRGMGAYAAAISTRFNGYGEARHVCLARP